MRPRGRAGVLLARLLPSLLLMAASRAEGQSVPGFRVEVYASLADPVRFDFGPSGELYCGRDVAGSGGGNGDPAAVWRVEAGGVPVNPFGAMIVDPDALFFDVAGTFTGLPNSVLVGGVSVATGQGMLSVIAPSGDTTTLHAAPPGFSNPSEEGEGQGEVEAIRTADTRLAGGDRHGRNE